MNKPFRGILVFSTVETLGIVTVLEIFLYFARIAGARLEIPLQVRLIAYLIVEAYYIVEHIIAFNVGKGRAYFAPVKD